LQSHKIPVDTVILDVVYFAFALHCVQAVEARAKEYVPDGQSMQAVAAVVPAYFPATQSRHVATAVAALAVEYFPVTQPVHVETNDMEYVPGTQSMHVVAGVPVYFPATQSRHVVAALEVEYFPVGQSMQVAVPVALLYRLALHDVHTFAIEHVVVRSTPFHILLYTSVIA
jgi:hypothetical protein